MDGGEASGREHAGTGGWDGVAFAPAWLSCLLLRHAVSGNFSGGEDHSRFWVEQAGHK